jgi:hypothetical protein
MSIFDQGTSTVSAEGTIRFELPIWVNPALEADDLGGLSLVTWVTLDEKNPTENRMDFEALVDEALDYLCEEGDTIALYTMAHELARHADRIRAAADSLEGDMPFYASLNDPQDDEYDER